VSGPRVGIIGARRVRQGLGPYVARDLVAAGASVPCFLATSQPSREAAARELREAVGVEACGYLDLAAMLAEEPLDALAILSPSATHGRYLAAAAERGLHVLCEKPFVWDEPDPVGRTRALLDAFAGRDLVVFENCQWPYTLPGFEALHPGALASPPRRFEMELEPMSRGRDSLGDALPHALSLLQALVPGEDARVEAIGFSTRDPRSDALRVRFLYRTEVAACEAEVALRRGDTLLRNASYSLDGRRARRLVAPQGYRLCLADADRRVAIADPLPQLVADFVAALAGADRGAIPPPTRILKRIQLLSGLVSAWESEENR
jgi:predicted dehydrogenase